MIGKTLSISSANSTRVLSKEEPNLETLRKKAKVSQDEVCWALKVNNSTYRNWEKGRKALTLPVWEYKGFLKEMAALFQCSEETLIRAFELSYLQGQKAKEAKKKKGK